MSHLLQPNHGPTTPPGFPGYGSTFEIAPQHNKTLYKVYQNNFITKAHRVPSKPSLRKKTRTYGTL